MTPAKNVTALIHRRLYRALLRAAKPFTPPSPNAVPLSCLLHRSFFAVELDENLATALATNPVVRFSLTAEEGDNIYVLPPDHDDSDEDDGLQYHAVRVEPHFLLFRRLLWTLFSDGDTYHYTSGTRHPVVTCYQHPQHVHRQPTKLRDMIRREFRAPVTEETGKQGQASFLSEAFPVTTRRETAFLTLRKLNEKLAWADQLQNAQTRKRSNSRSPKQAAKHVDKIEWHANSISSCLTPGTYLVAHPHLTGFFRKTVICILQHGTQHGTEPAPLVNGADDDDSSNDLGTYGVIVNRVTTKESTGNPLTLSEALPLLPTKILASIGALPMKDGGPVHMPSIQMVHMSSSNDTDQNDDDIGGIKLPSVTEIAEEKVVSYKGNIIKAADAVANGSLDKGRCNQCRGGDSLEYGHPC
jgi:putative AlgH/UPF0301 family transcriptional regulator